MDTATICHITDGLPWESCPHTLTAQDRQHVARTFAELRRKGADAHYAWLAAVETPASGEVEDWVRPRTAVS